MKIITITNIVIIVSCGFVKYFLITVEGDKKTCIMHKKSDILTEGLYFHPDSACNVCGAAFGGIRFVPTEAEYRPYPVGLNIRNSYCRNRKKEVCRCRL